MWFAAREWPEIGAPALSYYRKRFKGDIDVLRESRRMTALTTGLALKAERVERLKDHADRLEAIKWVPGKDGRLWNESAWREVLDDIAKEMGHRRAGVDLALEGELEALFDVLRDNLDPETYARVVALARGAAAT